MIKERHFLSNYEGVFTQINEQINTYHLERKNNSEFIFSISFDIKEFDNKGIKHILEHLIVQGSNKFPININKITTSTTSKISALTNNDYIEFCISSISKKDFNLAVRWLVNSITNPLFLNNKNLFLKEGVCKQTKDGKDVISGVVYNEIKNNYGVLLNHIDIESRKNHHENSYNKFNSSGIVEDIPKVTYEEVCNFYNVLKSSNIKIVIFGSENCHKEISIVKNWTSNDKVFLPVQEELTKIDLTYPASNSEKKIVVFNIFNDKASSLDKEMAYTLLLQYLNKKPIIKKSLLENNLCKEVVIKNYYSFDSSYISFICKGIKEENVENIKAIFKNEVEKFKDYALSKYTSYENDIDLYIQNAQVKLGVKDYTIQTVRLTTARWNYGINPNLTKENINIDNIKDIINESLDYSKVECLIFNPSENFISRIHDLEDINIKKVQKPENIEEDTYVLNNKPSKLQFKWADCKKYTIENRNVFYYTHSSLNNSQVTINFDISKFNNTEKRVFKLVSMEINKLMLSKSINIKSDISLSHRLKASALFKITINNINLDSIDALKEISELDFNSRKDSIQTSIANTITNIENEFSKTQALEVKERLEAKVDDLYKPRYECYGLPAIKILNIIINDKSLTSKFSILFNTLLSSSYYIDVISNKSEIETITNYLSSICKIFNGNLEFKHIFEKVEIEDYEKIDIIEKNFTTDSYGIGIKTSNLYPANICINPLSKILINTYTQIIREQNFAYGVYAKVTDSNDLFMYSFRDPNGELSLKAFNDIANIIGQTTEEEINNAIVAACSDLFVNTYPYNITNTILLKEKGFNKKTFRTYEKSLYDYSIKDIIKLQTYLKENYQSNHFEVKSKKK